MSSKIKASKVKIALLSISIAIIFVLFVGYGISTFYESPEREDFCGETKFVDINTQAECDEQGGKWNPSPTVTKPAGNQIECTKVSEENGNMTLNCRGLQAEESSGWCDADYYCREDYNEAREDYNRNVFIITLFIGLIGLVVGGIVLRVESVGTGLMGGSLLTILYGVIRYWGEAPDILRFTILGIVLAVLVWIGYKKLTPN